MEDKEQPKSSQDSYIPPPKDPYARFQTPYERRKTENEPNPFIEFRRLADDTVSQLFSGFPRMLGFDHHNNVRARQDEIEQEILKVFKEVDNIQISDLNQKMLGKWPSAWHDARETDQACSDAQPVPEGWKTKVDPWGRTWYKNKETGRMTRKCPDVPKDKHPITNSAEEKKKSVVDIVSPGAPAGWETAITSSGQTYYIHSESGRASKEKPDPTTLPHGWEEAYDNKGRVYFVDHINRSTTWNDPRSKHDKTPAKVSEAIHPWSPQEKSQLRGLIEATTSVPEAATPGDLEVSRDNSMTWLRGFEKCPDLASMEQSLPFENAGPQSELDQYEIIENLEKPRLDKASSRSKTQKASQLSRPRFSDWLGSGLGHDGKQQLKQLDKLISADESNFDSREMLSDKYGPSSVKAVSSLEEAINLNPPWLKSPYCPHTLAWPGLASMLGIASPEATRGDDPLFGKFEEKAELQQAMSQMLDWEAAFEDLMNEQQNSAIDLSSGSTIESRTEQRPSSESQTHLGTRNSGQREIEETGDILDVLKGDVSKKSTKTPSIIMSITNVTSRTLPDGSTEVRRELKKRFADGQEESEQSTTIVPSQKSHEQHAEQKKQNGWFWN